jgi:hypothetical protein
METLFNSFYLGNISEENNIYIFKKKMDVIEFWEYKMQYYLVFASKTFELD